MRTVPNLRAARANLNLTQRDVAAAVGVSPTAVRQWERGATPSRRNADKLRLLLQLRGGEISLATLDAVRPASPAAAQGPWTRARIVALWKLARHVVEAR
jgi:transcriptional regulator with XRE-family HTH domain